MLVLLQRRPLKAERLGSVQRCIASFNLLRFALRRLFDYLVGETENACWNFKAEHLGSLEIDYKFKLGRCLHWEITRLLATKDAIGIGPRSLEQIAIVNSIGR